MKTRWSLVLGVGLSVSLPWLSERSAATDSPATIELRQPRTVLSASSGRSTGRTAGATRALSLGAGETVTWSLRASRPDRYDVILTYACAPGHAGSTVEVVCGDSRVTGKVHSTGGEGEFLSLPLGLVSIPAGSSEIGVRVTAKPAGAASGMTVEKIALESGFTPLFNGKDLDGWQHSPKRGEGYVVRDGKLVCPKRGGGKLFTRKEYSDFHIRFEFLFRDVDANNGLGIRSPLKGDPAYAGMEIQILNTEWYLEHYRGLKDWQYHGAVYNLFPAKHGYLREFGQWNTQEVVCDGRRIRVVLNGTVIVDANLDDVKDPKVIKKHPGLARTTGHIGFLGHGKHVEFRNIRLRDLR